MKNESFPHNEALLEIPQNISEGGGEAEPEFFLNTLKKFNSAKSLDQKESEELARKTVEFLKNSEGEYCENVVELYSQINHEIIVRRENPLALVNALEHGDSLELGFEGGEAYSNAALWEFSQGSAGLANAFMEGFASVAGVCFVGGYEKKNLVIEKPHSSDVGLPKIMSEGVPLPRHLVVAASGNLSPDDIDFVVARIPYRYMPEDLLREDELDTPKPFVFRGILRNKKNFILH
jgi:hypothetical protein